MANPAGDALTAEQITQALRDIAEASKKTTATVQCKHCWKEGRYEIEVPDTKERLNAIKFMHENGYGKPSTAREDATKIDLDVDVTGLSPGDRGALRRNLLARYPELAPQDPPAPSATL